MAVKLQELVDHCDRLLNIQAIEDYCPNGLQVDAGGAEVTRIVSGVSASQALIDTALEIQADLLLVHHGFFWKGEPLTLTGIKGRRVRALMRGGVSLLAYHLPLDMHPELGNNRQLGERLGLDAVSASDEKGLLWSGLAAGGCSPEGLAAHIAAVLDRTPLHIGGGAAVIERIGWCTGAAQGYIEQAAVLGCQAFVSGEVSEQTTHLARELGIHYYAAGHHATERYGVQALGAYLAARYGVEHRFVDIANPV